jgi:thymidylate synthase (FAD)
MARGDKCSDRRNARVKEVEPQVRLIARPQLDWEEILKYLGDVGGEEWLQRGDYNPAEGQTLIEFAGRMCYRSWKPGLNPNVTRVRTDQTDYLRNILRSQHGSVLEHANYTFILQDVSRVLTHEWVRHRAGTAISQESLRFVRLQQIPLWLPTWVAVDTDLMLHIHEVVTQLEELQEWMAARFDIDAGGVPFHVKKTFTSFMRRMVPDGVATSLVWTANIRTLRHVIETRTDPGAEEEIRLVAGQIGTIMRDECPALFSDYTITPDGHWQPEWRKV